MLRHNLSDAAMLVSLWLDLARADIRLRLHRGENRKLLFHVRSAPVCAPAGCDIDAEIGRLARVMTAAARLHGPFNFSCLRQALVLQQRLRGLGVEARLSYGVKKQGSRIVAHAWIDIGGRTINGLPEIVPLKRPLCNPTDISPQAVSYRASGSTWVSQSVPAARQRSGGIPAMLEKAPFLQF